MSELMNEGTQQDVEYLTEEEKRFVCNDDRKADWLLRKRAEAVSEYDFWKQFYEEQTHKAEVAMNRKLAWIDFMLEGYFKTVPHKTSKTQESYLLPSGKLVLKASSVKYEHDDAQLLPWLKKNGKSAFVKVKESVDWAGLKKDLIPENGFDISGSFIADDNGEIVPGITVTSTGQQFKVEVK